MNGFHMPGRRPLGFALTLVVVALLGLLALPLGGAADSARQVVAPIQVTPTATLPDGQIHTEPGSVPPASWPPGCGLALDSALTG
jgi:hypothetical protein